MRRSLIALTAVVPLVVTGALVARAAEPVSTITVKADADDTWQSVALEYGYTGSGFGSDTSVSTAGDKLQRFNRVDVSTSDSAVIGAGAGIMVEEEQPAPRPTPTTSTTSTTTVVAPTTSPTTVATTTPAPAPTTTAAPARTTTTTGPPDHSMRGLHVDPGSLVRDPNGNSAFATNRLFATTRSPSPESTGWNGIIHVECRLSHMNWDDPIMYPGVPDASHLHAFYGDTAVDHGFTATRAPGATSTCTGGMANGSAYWTPAMVDLSTDGVVVSDYLQIYYRSGFNSPTQFHPVRPFPAGLRMIAGRTMADDGPTSAARHPSFTCNSRPVANESAASQQIPSCAPGQWLTMMVKFPQCWDGVNLDSPDHRSHMAFAFAPDGCPASHPVMLPEIVQFYIYPVGPQGTANWALSSDVYTDGDPSVPAGYTAHADWWNGWDPAIQEQISRNCWNGRIGDSRVDCHVNLIGPPSGAPDGPDGQELETSPGVP